MARPKSKRLFNTYSDSILTQRLRELTTPADTGLLAEKVGVSESSIRQWTSGATRPDIDKLPLIAEYFGCTTDYLLGTSVYKNKTELSIAENSFKQLVELLSLESSPADYADNISQILESLLLVGDESAGQVFRKLISRIASTMGQIYDYYAQEKCGLDNFLQLGNIIESSRKASDSLTYKLFYELIKMGAQMSYTDGNEMENAQIKSVAGMIIGYVDRKDFNHAET